MADKSSGFAVALAETQEPSWMTWREFLAYFCNSHTKRDLAVRRRTRTALKKLAKRVDRKTLLSFPRCVIFAPALSATFRGYAWASDIPYVYFSPTLEFNQQLEVDFTVAHEFAHMVLNHKPSLQKDLKKGEGKAHERAADRLAESWGFLDPDDDWKYEKYK
jgi:hypothetical protein